jgi:hypothetical protein
MPKWATPSRQAHLVNLFNRSQGFCVFGHKPCPYPEHHYELYIEGLIAEWISEDKAQAKAEWQAEQRRLHSLGERRYTHCGQWSAIGKDIWRLRKKLLTEFRSDHLDIVRQYLKSE